MKSKFFLRVLTVISAGCCVGPLSICRLLAQTPAPIAAPTSKSKTGYIRFWNMLPLGGGSLELVTTVAGSADRVLQMATPSNYYVGYTTLPPGAYALKVSKEGIRDKIVFNQNVSLRADTYLTLLATRSPDGQIHVEVLNDTPDLTKPPTNRLTVRQFVPDAQIVIGAAGQHTESMTSGGVQVIGNLPSGVVPIQMQATSAGGTVTNWTAEADFRASRHASLLVFSDPYGRIRPRVSVDGPSPEDQDTAAAEFRSKP